MKNAVDEKEYTHVFSVSYDDSKKNSLDLLLSLEERLKFLLYYYKENPNDINEVLNIIMNMYFFSNTSRLKEYMISICYLKDLPIAYRLECAKNIELESYKLFHILYNQEEKEIDELSTPMRIDCTIFYMQSEDTIHQENSLKYFCKIISDHNLEDMTRFKTIQNLENKINNREIFLNYTKVSTLLYILDSSNKEELRIVACQYFFEKIKQRHEEVVKYLTSIAENLDKDEDIRADSCDILLKYAFAMNDSLNQTEKDVILSEKENIEKILFQLGGGDDTRNNIFKNKQNVHMKSINESVERNLEKILNFRLYATECYLPAFENIDEIFEKIKIKLIEISKENNYDIETLSSALSRIYIDRASYGSKHMTLKNILIKIWYYIHYSPTITMYSKEVEKRLAEEIIESKGKCSSGFTARLLNSLSGFDDEMTISISFKDQIIANLERRLSLKLQNIKDLEYRDKILDEMTIDTSKFQNRSNFLKFFRENVSFIREDMYQEFKKFISDEIYDAYFKDAILHYEGS